MTKILIVDDDSFIREELAEIINAEDRGIMFAGNGGEAFDILCREDINLVLSDINMPVMDGFELIRKTHEVKPSLPVITVTAFGSTETAVKALRSGAYDFIVKPFSVEEVRNIVNNSLNAEKMFNEIHELRGRLAGRYSLDKMIGQCPLMQNVFETINRVAPANCNVFISGESGTGKELVAEAIHKLSSRKDREFVAVNCGSIPDGILESELFGHIRGSFTGAVSEKEGLVQSADGGTLFLDEIGDMPLSLQVKLLRLIQNRQIKKVGSTQPKSVDIRIIAATNQDLSARIKEKLFRKDLYYRINVVQIDMPPLRERSGDIQLLASHFLKHYSEAAGKEIEGISDQVMEAFNCYSWPGNIRELENAIERAVILCDGDKIGMGDLAPAVKQAAEDEVDTDGTLEESLVCYEEKCLNSALVSNNNNFSAAAKSLGISLATLYRKIKKHGIKIDSHIQEISGRRSQTQNAYS